MSWCIFIVHILLLSSLPPYATDTDLFLRNSSPQKMKFVINYSPSCHSKAVWLSSYCVTKKEMFSKMLTVFFSIQWKSVAIRSWLCLFLYLLCLCIFYVMCGSSHSGVCVFQVSVETQAVYLLTVTYPAQHPSRVATVPSQPVWMDTETQAWPRWEDRPTSSMALLPTLLMPVSTDPLAPFWIICT